VLDEKQKKNNMAESKFTLSHSITPFTMKELKKAFQEFDKDGAISKTELSTVMKKFLSVVSEREVEQMIGLVDVNGDGEIDFNEFLHLMENNSAPQNPEDEIKQLFGAFDKDDDGYITEDEIMEMMKSLGEKVDAKDIRKMMKAGDKTKSGKISFTEFKSMIEELHPIPDHSTLRLSHAISNASMHDELLKAFREFDHNKDGAISKTELATVMKKFPSLVSENEVEQMIKLVDVNGDGEIDFNEFLQLMENNSAPQNPVDEIKLLFGAFDKDDDGYITEDEIMEMMQSLGEKVSKKDVRKMMSEGDKNKNGRISFADFKSMMDSLVS